MRICLDVAGKERVRASPMTRVQQIMTSREHQFVQVDVPNQFAEHVKEVREQKNKPKIDFNSEEKGWLGTLLPVSPCVGLMEDFKRDPASFMTSGSSGVSMAFVQLDVKWVPCLHVL